MSSGILFVIGASGVGKTAAVTALATRSVAGVECFFFDQIGVPSPDEMTREFGGGEQWQAHATEQWVHRLATECRSDVSVLDGQTRPTFIHAAIALVGGLCSRTVLLDCSAGDRATRLANRGQSELATSQMNSWAAYLRGQAHSLGLPVVDTSALSIPEVADVLEREATLLVARVRGAT